MSLSLVENGHVLVLNGAAAGEGATGLIATLYRGEVVARRDIQGRGAAEQIAPLCRDLLRETGWGRGPDLIVGVVGPGSFTGLRATLALATGLALGYGCRLRGVTVGQTLRQAPETSHAYCLSIARRQRCFVEPPEGVAYACAPAAFTAPKGAVVTGDAALWLDEKQRERFRIVALDVPTPGMILSAAAGQPDVDVLLPLYVDAPEARPPAAGLRPSPI